MAQNGRGTTSQGDGSDREGPNFRMPDPAVVSRTMADVAERGQRIVGDFLKRQAEGGNAGPDPLNIGTAFLDMTTRLMSNPARLMQAQIGFWQDYLTLWQNTARRMLGDATAPVIEESKTDRRFKDEAWRENEVFDFIRQSYLLSARYFTNVVQGAEGLDNKTAQKVDFYTRQFVDAMSPSNFLMTNPEVLRRTAETGGENLLKGLSNLLSDLERGKGSLRIRMTDDSKFKVGENIAVTPGKVVSQRADGADPIRARDGDRAQAPAADPPTLDQQVLHSRFAAQEQFHPLGGGAGAYRVRCLLGQSGRDARGTWLRRLHEARRL